MDHGAPGSALVLGGAGFIGSAVVRDLVASRWKVTVLSRTVAPEAEWLDSVRFVHGDASDASAYPTLLDGITHVVFALTGLLPQQSNSAPLADVAHSLTPLLHLLDELRSRPTIRLVFLSSGGTVYGNPRTLPVLEDHPTNPLSSYGILKLTAEKYIGMYTELYGVDARVLRIANAYGPSQRTGRGQGVIGEFARAVANGEPLTIFGDGLSVRDYIYIDDVARAVTSAMRTGGPQIMNVGTGVGTSLLQLHQLFEDVLGRSLELRALPSRGFDVASIVLDSAALHALTGQPPTDLRTGLTWTLRAQARAAQDSAAAVEIAAG
ncbi:NAD-dependent epimerase/dehydratase family protein [Curtobacterium ammoniigenes]|uniref:NAD-dependent epimerase/dehydratase family protein n=1 Tax=Curtobacterium ammoniigenes TaxID=395387 RepID=UPI00082E750E|nr:NAD-dependent epimerase/dehydratase family protein [Curtobacterium ammoniigenes]